MARRRTALLAPLALLAFAHLAPAAQANLPGPGDPLWSYVEDSPAHALDGMGDVARGPNGSLYGAADLGFNYGDGGDIELIRFRANDTAADHVTWKRTWDNPDYHKSDYPIAIAVDPSGNAIVAGQTDAADIGGMDGVVVKWLANGTPAWDAEYANLVDFGPDWVTDVACDSRGNVYVSGSISAGGSYDWLVVKYRGSDGKILWREVYDGPKGSTGADSAEALLVTRDGFIYVTGSSDNLANDRDLIVMKVTPRGTYRWIKRLDGAAHLDDRGRQIGLRSGNLYVTGETETPGNGRDAIIVKVSTAGKRLWQRTWQPAAGAMLDVHDMALDRAGNTIIAGWDDKGTPSPRAFLVKWDAAGHRRWARQFWNTATGEPALFTALVTDGKGRIWVAGSIGGAVSTQDALLIRYDATGRRVWKSTVWGPDLRDDWFLDLVLCGTRDVFASGVMGSTAGSDDVLAVKLRR